MRAFGFLALLLFGVLAVTHIAYADTDQRCLGTCITSGKPSSSCMVSCSYNAHPNQATKTESNPGNSHRVLDTPVRSQELILTQQVNQPGTPTQDYSCLNQCLQQGLQYGLCKKNCLKTNCGTGTLACRGVSSANTATASTTPSSTPGLTPVTLPSLTPKTFAPIQ